MLEELSDYALVNKPKDALVNGNVTLKNSPNPQFGDRHYWNGPVTFIYPSQNGDSEIALKPGLLESVVAKSNGFGEKTDNNDEVCIANEKKFKVRRLHVLAGALALVLIATIATLIVVFTPSNYADNDHEDDDNATLRLVTRGEWFALPTTGPVDHMSVQPAPYIIVSEATSTTCRLEVTCSNVMRALQYDHTNFRNWSDIAYNFVIGNDGLVYIGRGWDIAGSHTLSLNSRSIGISFIGAYDKIVPSKRMISAFWKLIDKGVEEQKISANYTIFSHRQIRGSESPGKAFWELIKTWPNWRKYDAHNNKSLKIVTRGEWFALPPREVIKKLEVTPAPYVVLFSTESSACFTETICGNQIRSIQGEHFRRGFGDIGYNFLIGGDGAAYTGLGWNLHGAHTLPLNNRSIGVAVIGYFQKEKPPNKQILAFWELMEIGVKNNKIIANYTIFTHRDVVGSQSPGKAFYELIKTWPHYKMYDPIHDIPPYT